MKVKDFVNTAIKIANEPTVYYSVAGGAWCKWNGSSWNMDCVCMIKGILWGFNFNKSASHGGAIYGSNGVYDDNADGIVKRFTTNSTDFNNIEYGEVVHMAGHVGIYIGNGQVVESTAWFGRTIISNIGKDGKRTKDGRNGGYWQNHGKIQYVDYSENKPTPSPSKSIDELAREVIAGKYGNGDARKQALGSLYSQVQARVNEILKGNTNPSPSKRYLNLKPTVNSWTVYKTNKYFTPSRTSDVAGRLNPAKFGGLTYEILEDCGNYHFKIKTQNFGTVYIAGNPNKYPCTITNTPTY